MNRLATLVFAFVIAAESTAAAGGMFLPTRGVRPTARGGAFVAGADDLGAMWFNPAGLAATRSGEPHQFLFDMSYVSQRVSYERMDSGFNELESIDSENTGLPIPTLGISFDVADDIVIAGGILAPYAALGRYDPEGPQRYSLVDLSDTKMIIAEVAVGWQVTDKLRLGAGLQNMYADVVSSVVFNGCPGQTVCAPEDPEFDSLSHIEQTDYFSPSGVVGVQYAIADRVRTGAAFQLPFRVSGTGDLTVVLPSTGFFNGASVSGDKAAMTFTLPAMLRAGIEVDPFERWHAELAVDIEFWSMHDEFLVEPENVRIEDAPGVGTYQIGDMRIPREFDNSVSVKLGVEGQPLAETPLTVAFGYAYETAAAPDEYLSVMTVDGVKNLFAAGLGYRFGNTRVFVSGSYVAVGEREVTQDEGVAPQLSPIRDDNQTAPLDTFVNWGTYRAHWYTAGLGVASEF
jgi:long-chain fatty acid transport protein